MPSSDRDTEKGAKAPDSPPAYEVAWDRTLKFARNAFANFGLTDEQLTEYARSIYDDLVAHLIPQPPPPASGEVGEMVEILNAKHNDTWPRMIGYGDLINEDGPAAADLLARVAAERDDLNRRLVAAVDQGGNEQYNAEKWQERAEAAEARLAMLDRACGFLTEAHDE